MASARLAPAGGAREVGARGWRPRGWRPQVASREVGAREVGAAVIRASAVGARRLASARLARLHRRFDAASASRTRIFEADRAGVGKVILPRHHRPAGGCRLHDQAGLDAGATSPPPSSTGSSGHELPDRDGSGPIRTPHWHRVATRLLARRAAATASDAVSCRRPDQPARRRRALHGDQRANQRASRSRLRSSSSTSSPGCRGSPDGKSGQTPADEMPRAVVHDVGGGRAGLNVRESSSARSRRRGGVSLMTGLPSSSSPPPSSTGGTDGGRAAGRAAGGNQDSGTGPALGVRAACGRRHRRPRGPARAACSVRPARLRRPDSRANWRADDRDCLGEGRGIGLGVRARKSSQPPRIGRNSRCGPVAAFLFRPPTATLRCQIAGSAARCFEDRRKRGSAFLLPWRQRSPRYRHQLCR